MNDYLQQALGIIPEDSTLIFLSYVGSKLYGTDNENSDTDIKGLYIPSKADLFLRRAQKVILGNSNSQNQKNTKDDVDLTLYPFDKFISDLIKGESQALDLYFAIDSESEIYCNSFLKILKDNIQEKDLLRSKNVKSFIGYCVQQAKKYGVKGSKYGELLEIQKIIEEINKTFPDEIRFAHLERYIQYFEKTICEEDKTYLIVLGKKFNIKMPYRLFVDSFYNIINSYGERAKTAQSDGNVDFKGLSHTFRVIDEVEEFLITGKIEFPLKERQFILNVKHKHVSISDCVEFLEKRIKDIDELIKESELPETSNKEEIERLSIKFIKKILFYQ